ncbi:hypothetical protein [Streptomyces anulatus]|uniref:hypothetical protein n=1 Tax=Streptomyces anulatus TaxID=1892 RepID=UPI0022549B97|nr:hypothetical protein [Streptomyces anulatus]MCX4504323.1 hypothetical protein [Streptomyces anulatus]
MRDIYSNVLVTQSLTPAVRTATATGTAVDRNVGGAMFQNALVVVTTGVITDATHTITVQDSDDGTSYATVAAEYLQGTAPAIVAADDSKTYELGYLGRKRYLRVVSTVAGATTGGAVAALVVLSDPRVTPVVRA